MTPVPTFAAAAERLRGNGYDPIRHRIEGAAVRTMSLTAPPLVALAVRGNLADRSLERRVLAVLTRHGLTCGPVRFGPEGDRTWPLRLLNALPAENPWRALNGAVSILYALAGHSAIISLDGAWPQGTLLAAPYSALPALDRRRIVELMAEAASLSGVRHRA